MVSVVARITGRPSRQADRVVAQANNGGQLVETVLRTVDPSLPLTLVHASRGKLTRAEPIAALYEQAKVAHVGAFPELEDELCTWVPGMEDSPDRLDALGWALTELAPGTVAVSAPIFSTRTSRWEAGAPAGVWRKLVAIEERLELRARGAYRSL